MHFKECTDVLGIVSFDFPCDNVLNVFYIQIN